MAEIVVNFVRSKLTDVVVTEILQLYRVDEQVETVSRELRWIQPFLKDADKKQITDERQKHWVKEVRDVAYLIEDAIDTFLSEVPQEPQKFDGMIKAIKRLTTKIKKKLPAVHRLVHEITKIQARMNEIEKNRLRYGIDTLGENNGETKLPIWSTVLPNIDPDVVGFKEDRDHVVNELLDVTTKELSVVSIWGVGGLGKTILAQKVYNCYAVKAQFKLRIWVAISQNFKLIDILRQIAEQLKIPINPSKQPNVILTEFHESLKDRRYLIVLDDVWTNNLWTQIEAALPRDQNGSRVLITTRNFKVAKNVYSKCEPYKLGFLTEELSVELFLKKALPNHGANKSTFDGLYDISNEFVRKCDKLPLALVVLGDLLAKKQCQYNDWLKLLKTMSWLDDDVKICSEIIGTSYEDLSFVLKSCFMYFAAFPKNKDINAKSLLQMWIAEGFIPKDDNRTLEETAETYLVDLVERSLVQVKSRSLDGSIENCCIHDLLRELAIEKAKEDNFFVVYSHSNDQESLSRARRVAVHHPVCDELVMGQNLRTLLCFHNEDMPNCSKQKLLKVVSTGDHMGSIEFRMFEGLNHLRYLNLIGNLSDNSIGGDQRYGERYLKKVIGTMKCIQTLNLSLTVREGIVDDFQKGIADNFPDCAWHIKTLRHVTTQFYPELPSSTKLPNLQTLAMVNTNESWETELFPLLPNLRTLGLHHKSSPWMVVVAFLGTLKHLISLNLTGSFPGDIFDMRNFPFYQHLQSLTLDLGTPNEMAIDVIMLPPHLIYLEIKNCHFRQDVMSVLENLCCLKILILHGVKTNPKMRCSARGFNQLEVLKLIDVTLLEDWEIEEEAMPILRELWIEGCDRLCFPQGLQHLIKLQILKSHWSKEEEIKNVTSDVIQGKTGRIYMPDQKVGDMPLSNNIKGLKRERREAKQNKEVKKRKTASE